MGDQGSEGLLSPYLRSKRLEVAKPHIKGKVLDFGCGSGALASLVNSNMYIGVDIDQFSLRQAKLKYPEHSFVSELSDLSQKFETIISLAVIEHVDDTVVFFQSLARCLDDLPSARIVITTPHPAVEWVHDLGASMGLFSRHANEEHNDLLDQQKLTNAGAKAGLKLELYSRFLFGANQIATYSKVAK